MSAKEKNKKILDLVKDLRSREQIVDVNIKETKLVIFTLEEDFFAFSGSKVKEILTLELGEINFVPGVPDYILGVVNVRGDIESVINISGFLGLPPQRESKENRVIIAAAEGARSGILVGSVEDVLDVPEESIKPPLSAFNNSLKRFVVGELEYKSRNVTFLDIDRIFEKIVAG